MELNNPKEVLSNCFSDAKKDSASVRLHVATVAPSPETYPCIVRDSGKDTWEVVEVRSEKVHASYRGLKSALEAARLLNHGALIRKRLAELAEWNARVA